MLVEREGPLGALRAQAERAKLGHGGVVLVGGEAGIGKTALLAAFSESNKSTTRVLWGGCEALFTPRPLGPLQDMARDLGLERMLAEVAAPARLFAALVESLKAATAPTIMIFEDVHWADHSTLDLIKYLGRRIGALSPLATTGARPGASPLATTGIKVPAAASSPRVDPLGKTAVDPLARTQPVGGPTMTGLGAIAGPLGM